MLSRNDYLKLIAILVLWAGNVIAIKIAVTEIAPLTAATLRFALAGLIFLPFMVRPDRRTFTIIFQIAMLMNVIHIGLLFFALRMLDAASVSVLLQMQVVFATILGVVIFKESIAWRTWTGLGLAVVGIVIMCGEPDLAQNPHGVAIMVVSTFALALSYVRMKQLQSVHPATYICLMSLCAVPFTFSASMIAAPDSWAALPDADWLKLAGVLLYQSVLVSLSHITWQRLMHRGDVGKLTAYNLLIPFLAILLSVVMLGEHIAMPMIIGGIVTMLGVGIITLRRIQKGIAAPPEQNNT